MYLSTARSIGIVAMCIGGTAWVAVAQQAGATVAIRAVGPVAFTSYDAYPRH
jgi:hypothetical protein